MLIVDKVTGGQGLLTINGAGLYDINLSVYLTGGKGNTDVMDGGADADVLQLSTGSKTVADDAKLNCNIELRLNYCTYWRIGSGPFCSDGSTDDYG